MDERIKITKQHQISFFKLVKSKSNKSWEELGAICHITGRTLRDWARGKYTVSKGIAILLSENFGVALPEFEILDQYWYIKKYARRGALARQRKYGLLGTVETRRQAGIISQMLRRQNPEKYRLMGCNVRKEFPPLEHSVYLAELCGILLGDGGITNNQVTITLNRHVDKEYSKFVISLLYKILKERPYITERKNVLVLIISGVGLVESLEKIGLKRGNKVSNQVNIPKWIMANPVFAKACLRGLVDTDGCVYLHNHTSGGILYQHVGLNFSNHSLPLLLGVYKILSLHDIKSSLVEGKGVYIYKLGEVKKYFKIVKSHNSKHIQKLKKYLILKQK